MNANDATPWVERFRICVEAGVAHTFVFSLNVMDYVLAGEADAHRTLKDFLCSDVLSDRRLVVYYDRSAGISFGGKNQAASNRMAREFRRLAGLDEKKALPPDPASAFSLLETVLTADAQYIKEVGGLNPEDFPKGSIAVIIGYAETVVPAGEVGKMSADDRTNVVTLARWTGHRAIDEQQNLIVLLTVNEADLASHLRSGAANVVTIRVPLPKQEERAVFAAARLEKFQGPELAEGTTIDVVARASAGLSLRALENILRLAKVSERPLDESFIWSQKKEAINRMCGGLLEVVRPVWTFEHVGGLDCVKRYLSEIAEAIRQGFVTQVPQGILFTGPPGTGKTIMAEALANELGFPMVKLRDIQEMWVGQSERNLSLVFDLIEEFAPVVVFEDEIDQQEQARGTSFHGDSGVSARLMARKLAFLSDTTLRGKVLWIAATNHPDLMDQAMLRPGRFDTKIPFLLPTPEERPKILAALIRKFVHHSELAGRPVKWQVPGEDIEDIARGLDGYSGAEMELVLTRAQSFAGRRKRAVVGADDIRAAVEDTILSRNVKEYEYMTLLALRECNSLELLPESYQSEAKDLQTTKRLAEFYELAQLFGKKPAPGKEPEAKA